jgi:hypothetical protein
MSQHRLTFGEHPREIVEEYVCSHLCSPICLVIFVDEDEVHVLRCEHVFHANCIEAWFKGGHLACPLCRKACSVTPNIPRDVDALPSSANNRQYQH